MLLSCPAFWKRLRKVLISPGETSWITTRKPSPAAAVHIRRRAGQPMSRTSPALVTARMADRDTENMSPAPRSPTQVHQKPGRRCAREARNATWTASGSSMAQNTPNSIGWAVVPATRRRPSRSRTEE